jgi:hypothetical protein
MASRTITDSAQTLLPQNRLRKSFIIQNEDSTINVFMKFEKPGQSTVSTTDHDHRLGPGGLLALNWQNDGKEQIQERITVVAASGTPLISFFETEEERR